MVTLQILGWYFRVLHVLVMLSVVLKILIESQVRSARESVRKQNKINK